MKSSVFHESELKFRMFGALLEHAWGWNNKKPKNTSAGWSSEHDLWCLFIIFVRKMETIKFSHHYHMNGLLISRSMVQLNHGGGKVQLNSEKKRFPKPKHHKTVQILEIRENALNPWALCWRDWSACNKSSSAVLIDTRAKPRTRCTCGACDLTSLAFAEAHLRRTAPALNFIYLSPQVF